MVEPRAAQTRQAGSLNAVRKRAGYSVSVAKWVLCQR